MSTAKKKRRQNTIATIEQRSGTTTVHMTTNKMIPILTLKTISQIDLYR